MLSAVNAHGEVVVLAGPGAKLLAIQAKEIPHFCPQCGGSVIVKAGDVNIPHFAHTSYSSCDSFSEHESPRHLAGKADLYQWIMKTSEAKMEARLPDGSQRPDILSGKIAVEFQCSTISAALFKERTDKYTARGMTPFWIYGGKPVERKGRYMKLTPFQRLFLRYHSQLGFYFMSYCPDQKGFTIYERIIPVTPTLCEAECRFVRVEEMSFPPSAAIGETNAFPLGAFFDEKRKWIDRALYFGQARRHPFFQAVYTSGRNPYLLPEFIGLPVRSSMVLRNHPIEWQFYLLIGEKNQPAEEIIRRRIKLGHLKEQPLPLINGLSAEKAAKEYVDLLQLIGKPKLADSRSMVAKLQNEQAFLADFEKTVINRLIF
ncbi:competence protein CoiA [Domibacillus iocasae]|uniref:Competence protein CoiA n=1 Tax=Domibacillus iocasae TaxID=1714016 RepID=A0A1E7DLP3_9BACI|nr:competence protein CoiA family protein [Domibacillus iocasae]OES43925.1 hypothetical protein BA724_12615 [Domibacillus iocasae]